MLVGFFLPGDTLLFTAGLFCTTSAAAPVHLSLTGVLAAAVGAIAGAQVGYLIGRAVRPPLFERPDRRRLLAGAERSREFFARYGHGRAIVLARFVPLVRTLLNPVAGALRVPARTFTLWNIVGGLVWTVGVTVAGYALGSSIPNIDQVPAGMPE